MTGGTADRRVADGLARIEPLLAEIGDLKRVRLAGRTGSLAEQGFIRSWVRLVGGEPTGAVARTEAAAAVAGARLAGLDRTTLDALGVEDPVGVLRAGFDEVADALPAAADLRAALDDVPVFHPPTAVPSLVTALVEQPRAGATRPGHARIVVEPPESHGDHCWAVAVYGVLLAPLYAADPAAVFLLGLAHHLHNAALPDAGFTGEVLLGDRLGPLLARLTAEALDILPADLAGSVRELLPLREDAAAPESRTFHAADVLDRVLQVHHHARAAAFTADQALVDLDLVHPGPVQEFQLGVLEGAGLGLSTYGLSAGSTAAGSTAAGSTSAGSTSAGSPGAAP